MYYDDVINLCLIGIYTFLVLYTVVMIVWKPFHVSVTYLNASIVLRYQHGFSKRRAVLRRSDSIKKPTILKNFDHFSFVVPVEMTTNQILNWLHSVEISKHYAAKGKEALELLRATLLYYYTLDLEEIPLFKVPVHHRAILRCMRNNRYALKSIMYIHENMPVAKYLPLKAPLYRSM